MNIHKFQKGITFIEVLVAALIVAIGVIGFSALQTRALESSISAAQFSNAASSISDLGDRIRASIAQADTVADKQLSLDTYVGYDWGGAVDCGVTPNNIKACGPEGTYSNGTCTSDLMAEYNAYEAKCSIQVMLPSPNVAFEQCSGTSSTYCLYISWKGEQANAANCVSIDGHCVKEEIYP